VQVIGAGKGVAVSGWVVLECCWWQGEMLLDGCHQQQVDPVGFLHVSGDLMSQGVKVKRFLQFCCIRKVGVMCWRGGKGVWLVWGLGGGVGNVVVVDKGYGSCASVMLQSSASLADDVCEGVGGVREGKVG